MLEDKPRISVLMVTYNQEQLVSRALNSLLSQKDYLYEICINDDCSTDGTFNVLLDYQQNYPDLVKPVRNEHNLGICKNVEETCKRPSGDIIYRLAGDDEAGENYFRQVLEFIENRQIDYKNELFCIYGDYKQIEPNESFVVYKNRLATKHDAVKLHIRKLLCNRSACFSKKVLDCFERVADDRTYNAEFVQDIQLSFFTKTNYYLPSIGNVYYAGIGVSAKADLEKTKKHLKYGYEKLISFLENHDRPLDKKDLAYIEFMKAHQLAIPIKEVVCFIKSIDYSLGFEGLGVGRILYVIKKRIRGRFKAVNHKNNT